MQEARREAEASANKARRLARPHVFLSIHAKFDAARRGFGRKAGVIGGQIGRVGAGALIAWRPDAAAEGGRRRNGSGPGEDVLFRPQTKTTALDLTAKEKGRFSKL